ncbi:MAG TPA: FAD-binding oxidoreductase [Xanthobacteraceae bacterium]|jgi:FAD/FMN-containing dehydrogenase|nr:FAD-binding oxidoreductase [Xanthobacteraceae bacterium]
MAQAATQAVATSERYPLAAFLADIAGIAATTDPIEVKRKSRDYYWYSPILYALLKDLHADVIVTPKSEDEVVRVAAACARHRIPLTVRGGGTGNYGQCVPLEGGVVLDMIAMTRIEWQKPGLVRVEAGAKLYDIDAATRPNGYELRMHPSTKRSAQIGGFVAGGSGGVGSVTFGGMREPGNVVAARVVTLEETPRVIELRGDAAQKISRAFGTTGIITVLEMPLAPVQPWIDVIVAFDDLLDAVRFGQAIAMADGIVKKLVSPIEWPLPSHFSTLRASCPDNKSMLLAMIGEMSIESFETLLAPFGGTITYKTPSEDVLTKTPLYEHTWNHTTLQTLKTDRGVTYLQCLYPHDRIVDAVAGVRAKFGAEVAQHLEFLRINGVMTASGIPVLRYSSPERVYEIMAGFEECGVMIANPHVFTVEDGSRYKRVDADQLGFKYEADPMGLLNPGKMRSFVPLPGPAAE